MAIPRSPALCGLESGLRRWVPRGVPVGRARRCDRATRSAPRKVGQGRSRAGGRAGDRRGPAGTDGEPQACPHPGPAPPLTTPRPPPAPPRPHMRTAARDVAARGWGGRGRLPTEPRAPRAPTGLAFRARPRSPGAGGLRAQGHHAAESPRRGRGRAGAGGRLPRPAHSPPPWPCARGRRWPRRDPRMRGRALIGYGPPGRRSTGAGPGAGGAWSGRGAGGAQ